MDDQQKQSTIAVLTAALHNAKMVRDQLDSLADDYQMEESLPHMDKAISLIERELEALNG